VTTHVDVLGLSRDLPQTDSYLLASRTCTVASLFTLLYGYCTVLMMIFTLYSTVCSAEIVYFLYGTSVYNGRVLHCIVS